MRSVVNVTLLTFFHGIFGSLVDRKINKLNKQITRVVDKGRNVIKDFFHALFKEPFIRFLLNLDEVRHFQLFVNL